MNMRRRCSPSACEGRKAESGRISSLNKCDLREYSRDLLKQKSKEEELRNHQLEAPSRCQAGGHRFPHDETPRLQLPMWHIPIRSEHGQFPDVR